MLSGTHTHNISALNAKLLGSICLTLPKTDSTWSPSNWQLQLALCPEHQAMNASSGSSSQVASIRITFTDGRELMNHLLKQQCRANPPANRLKSRHSTTEHVTLTPPVNPYACSSPCLLTLSCLFWPEASSDLVVLAGIPHAKLYKLTQELWFICATPAIVWGECESLNWESHQMLMIVRLDALPSATL